TRQDADRHVALRVIGFPGRGRDGIETDVGEEDDPRSGQNAAQTVHAPGTGVGWHERVPVVGVDITHAEQDEQHDHGDLDGDDERVEDGRLLDADVTDGGNDPHDQDGGQVDDGPGESQVQSVRALIERCVRECGGDVKVQLIEQADHVTRPADRNRGD